MKKYSLLPLFLLLITALSCSKDGGDVAYNNPSSGQGGSLARFTVSGNYLYAVNGTSIKVFNISDREKPVYLSSRNVNFDVETIFARDKNTLFIGTTSGMLVYDISNSPNINQISQYQHIVSCDPVVADEKYAYVTLRSENDSRFCQQSVNSLDIIDISNLSNPQQVSSTDMIHPLGLGIYGDTLLVCDKGVKVFDVSDGANPRLINAQENIDAKDIIPYNDLMIVSTSTGISQYRFKNGKLQFLSKI